MAIITASNGFKIRPIAESDVTFVTESLKDFPLGVMSYSQRLNEFSTFIYCSEGFTDAKVANGENVAITMILEKVDGTPVGLRYYNIDNKVAEVRMGVIHPSHRGNKYETAQGMLGAYWAFTHLSCTSGFFESVDNTQINESMTTASNYYTTISNNRDSNAYAGPVVSLNKVTVTPEQYEAHRAAHSTWSSITYTVS